MEYDRDSFLAGFAVGRTLWRPHSLAEGRQLAAFPCFPLGEPIDLEWSITGSYEFSKFLLTNPEGRFPTPAYWMIWECTDSPSYTCFLLFSADPNWDQSEIFIFQMYGCDGSIQDWRQLSATAGSFSIVYTESDIAKWQTNYRFTSNMTPSQFTSVIPYLSATEQDKNTFMASARLVQGPGQLYIVGEVS